MLVAFSIAALSVESESSVNFSSIFEPAILAFSAAIVAFAHSRALFLSSFNLIILSINPYSYINNNTLQTYFSHFRREAVFFSFGFLHKFGQAISRLI